MEKQKGNPEKSRKQFIALTSSSWEGGDAEATTTR
jgi:hypothetical protein